jgi:transglutaminase-like putative cysteine protease
MSKPQPMRGLKNCSRPNEQRGSGMEQIVRKRFSDNRVSAYLIGCILLCLPACGRLFGQTQPTSAPARPQIAAATQLPTTRPAQSENLSAALKTSNPVVYQITMTTRFIVPVGSSGIDRLRVYHALPTLEFWNQSPNAHGARDVSFTPDSAKELYDKATDSHYILWTLNHGQKPGATLSFTTHMTVTSVARHLDVAAAKVAWEQYSSPPADKAAVVDPDIARRIEPELVKLGADWKAKLSPPQAVAAMCQWIVDNIKYDAFVQYGPGDVASTLKYRRGHCGHQANVLHQLTAAVGIPFRTVVGMNLYAPDGRTSDLQAIRADYTNIHTWAEVYFPGIGWVEVDPALGTRAFFMPASRIQNNHWFQNYMIEFRENGEEKEPTWTADKGSFQSDYGVEHIISYVAKHPTDD